MTSDDLALVKGIIIDAVEASVKSTVPEEIQKKVNGKIDRLTQLMETHNAKHEADMIEVRKHMAEVGPILETYRGFSTTGNLIKWVAGVGTAIGVLWILFKGFFHIP